MRAALDSLLSPSMMCAELSLDEALTAFAETRVEYLHLDIMDGSFVPNFALGTDYCRKLRQMTQIPFDYHFMVENVDNKLDYFDIREGDIVSIHAETTNHLQRILCIIRDKGALPFVAINPATPLSALDYVLDDIDGVLLMTVNPGFAGQAMVPAMLRKIGDARALLDRTGHRNVHIEVDGNVSFEKAPLMRKAGADIFVGGTSSIFRKGESILKNVDKMRTLLP